MTEQKDSETRIALLIISALITAVVAGVLWFGASQASSNKKANAGTSITAVTTNATAESQAPATPTESAPATNANNTVTAESVQTTNEDAYIVQENGVVNFYFAVGKTEIATGAAEALLDVVTATNSGKKATISGFTDSTGNQAQNEELAKQRAFAVRDTLLGLNVPESSLELQKPEALTGTGSAAEARRVEVRLAD